MAFTSWTFPVFVGLIVILYYLIPKRAQWVLLLAASTAFYLSGGPGAFVWLGAIIAVTWTSGLFLSVQNKKRSELEKGDKDRQARIKRRKKQIAAITLLFCFGLLYAMKYWDFTVDLFPAPIEGHLPRWDFIMPLGLSFFTFQSVGYVIDVYRGKYEAQKNLLKYALFVSFFPQIMQGPIGRYDALAPQLLEQRSLNWRNIKFGIQLALWGYFKKLVIADRAAVIVRAVVQENCPYGGAVIAAAILMYCIQLYCDFSGGIDVTRGVARMLGVDMAENFRRPIFATSLTDYWRRWHITLGQWMRDYLFYPLAFSKPFGKLGKWARKHVGGLPGKIFATSLATFVVYFVIGIWHGANFRYIVFGFWNGALITASLLMERRFQAWKSSLHINDKSLGWRIVMTARTCFLVFLGRYLTCSPRLLTALSLIAATFTQPQIHQIFDGTFMSLGLSAGNLLIVILGMAVILAVEFFQEKGGHVRETLEQKSAFVQWLAIFIPLAVILFLGVFRSGYIPSEFIYKQF